MRNPRPTDLASIQRSIFLASRKNTLRDGQLIRHLLSPGSMEAAWERVSNSKGSQTPGPDGVRCRDIQGRSKGWLRRLAGELESGRWQPTAPEIVEVPKPNGKMRRLGILNIADRVVHAAIKQVLEPVLDSMFHRSSFGFRPGRSVAAAMHGVVESLQSAHRSQPFTHGVHLDIRNCFDCLQHQQLNSLLASLVPDRAVCSLVASILTTSGSGKRGWFIRRRVGVVQGSGLSPLLCNLYLHGMDMLLESVPQVVSFRYADDLLVLGTSRRAMVSATRTLRSALSRIGLRLRDRVPDYRAVSDGIRWLGLDVIDRRQLDSIPGYTFEVPRERLLKMTTKLDELIQPAMECSSTRHFNKADWMRALNEKLREWKATWQYAGNFAQVFQLLDQLLDEKLNAALRHLDRSNEEHVRRSYQVALSRGFRTWEVGGVRLVRLSSLAPRRPVRLIRNATWQTAV